jgi:hypothetical protein
MTLQESCTQYRTRPATFVMCQSCFWCASFLQDRPFRACPLCSGRALDSIPISERETYSLKIWHNCNVEIDFSSRRR